MRQIKKFKNRGFNSKKAQRVARADARAKAWNTLTDAQKQEVKERNMAEYNAARKA